MASTLWGSLPKMLGYDILMFSCEGGQYPDGKDPHRTNVEAYPDAGGRLFLSHLHFNWLRSSESAVLPGTADYIGVGADLPEPSTGIVNTTFPKGDALANWLVGTGASTVLPETTMGATIGVMRKMMKMTS